MRHVIPLLALVLTASCRPATMELPPELADAQSWALKRDGPTTRAPARLGPYRFTLVADQRESRKVFVSEALGSRWALQRGDALMAFEILSQDSGQRWRVTCSGDDPTPDPPQCFEHDLPSLRCDFVGDESRTATLRLERPGCEGREGASLVGTLSGPRSRLTIEPVFATAGVGTLRRGFALRTSTEAVAAFDDRHDGVLWVKDPGTLTAPLAGTIYALWQLQR